jgi:hypothetical protein
MGSWSVAARTGPSQDWPSARVWLDREDLVRLEPSERDMILELDSRLWGGELPVSAEWRRPDSWLLDNYVEDEK